MMTDTVLKNTGMKILVEKLGKVEAERFIALTIKESIDSITFLITCRSSSFNLSTSSKYFSSSLSNSRTVHHQLLNNRN